MTRTRRWSLLLAVAAAVLLGAQSALACGGLVGPGGTVQLARTTTLAGYHDGVEHYLTSFTYAGGEGQVRLDRAPARRPQRRSARAASGTLQRLVRETQPQPELLRSPRPPWPTTRPGFRAAHPRRRSTLSTSPCCAAAAGRSGTGPTSTGFGLSVDAPEVLDFYAALYLHGGQLRRPPGRGYGQRLGDGTPIHLTIPTADPWVPLRILGLGREAADPIQADVYLLTDRRPAVLPNPVAAGERGVAWSGAAQRPRSSWPTCASTRAWAGCRPRACGSATASIPPAG